MMVAMILVLLLVLLLSVSSQVAAQAELPVPDNIQSGDTVLLACGRTYVGELDVAMRRNVRIKTQGDCGPATITPARPVTNWQRDKRSPRLWHVAIDFLPVQLSFNGRVLPLAHFPNSPQIWVRGHSRQPGVLHYPFPSADLAGATLVWRAADWLIQTQLILRYAEGAALIDSTDDDGFGLLPDSDFYLEGKRWMLDAPGEWVFENGQLYLWPPDGKSPEGKVWAAPRARGINASGSQSVQIRGVKISNATLGIDGSDAQDLSISETEILYSGEDAVLAGGRGLRISNSRIFLTGQNGIRANDDATDVEITDSSISGAGMLGLPRRSKGAIVFEQARGVRILRNQITESSYIAIRVFRDTVVMDNQIERACLQLSDCGGIYTFARDHQPLHLRIERNRISHLAGSQSYAIYLDDYANGVLVSGNELRNNPGGMQLHNAFDNLIEHNLFDRNLHEQILFNETGGVPAITNNQLRNNRFTSEAVPVFRLWSVFGESTVRRFARFEHNVYVGTPKDFAEVAGRGMLGYAVWSKQISREAGARHVAPRKPCGSVLCKSASRSAP